MKPTGSKSLLDPRFKYKNSSETDLRETFARVRREMKKQAQPTTVVQLKREVLATGLSCEEAIEMFTALEPLL